jgi:ketosteroid isomerase-like protein
MLRCFVVLIAAALLAAASPDQDIRSVLDRQVNAWNRGDVHGFMDGYADLESTTFVGAKITKGHAQVLSDYLKRYPTKAAMGTLRFSDLEIKLLGADYVSVIGRWHLDRDKAAGGEAGGIFTLLFQRTAGGWKIILDHTS